MRMKLYRVAPLSIPEFMVVAKDTYEAGEVFTTYATAQGFFRFGKLIIERYDEKLSDERIDGLAPMLDRGVPGVAKFTGGVGWSLIPPG